MKPLVAIVGRPNVGKSTLFNRLIRESRAVVSDQPGTTRDRIYGDAHWQGLSFTLVDTGGLVSWGREEVVREVRKQVETALVEADAILFLVDARDGLLAEDQEIANLLRRSHKPVFLVANKAEGKREKMALGEFYALGLGDPYPVSALHGLGMGDLLEALVKALPAAEEGAAAGLGIAIVGRPNVGKSSLLNALVGQKRAIVTSQPGTTRDALDTAMEWKGQPVTLIDTAGIRRRGRIQKGIEEYSVLRALRAIERSQVVFLVMDAQEGILAQDAHLAGFIAEAGKGLIILVNKWDLVPNPRQAQPQYISAIRQALDFVAYAPIYFVSALTGEGISGLLDVAFQVFDEMRRQIPELELSRFLQEAVARHSPPSKAGKKLQLRSVKQVGVEPPTFLFEVNDHRLIHFSYQRYLENRLRQAFDFWGTPIRLKFQTVKKKPSRPSSHSPRRG